MKTDVWSMDVYAGEELKLSFEGKKPRTVSEILLGTKQYMEGEKQKWLTSQNAKASTVS